MLTSYVRVLHSTVSKKHYILVKSYIIKLMMLINTKNLGSTGVQINSRPELCCWPLHVFKERTFGNVRILLVSLFVASGVETVHCKQGIIILQI